ncbi:hypothetical protein MSAN_00259800 [Mycena sanguinolenta]|uniref:Uncharacterized protein n=1 Tax=Mycena sanguinolenta TaxID=230812 RepID=A0A8H6ZG33_9AGAR|nr:hypothetical protein MSAN_00259800 [Mycena sanguinolenta]
MSEFGMNERRTSWTYYRPHLLLHTQYVTMSFNPDMQGYIVRLSNFVTHIGAAILIATSPRSPRFYYAWLFLQIFFILLGVLISIHRDQISISDAEFAVLLTRSPICTYCVLFVIPRLFVNTLAPKLHNAVRNIRRLPRSMGWNELKRDLGSRAVFDGFFGALILLLCLTLDISVRFNAITKFYSPVACATGECWTTQFQLDIGTVHRWAALGLASVVIYECILTRHKELRWKLMRTLSSRYPSLRKSVYWKRGVCGFFCNMVRGALYTYAQIDSFARYIAAKLHPWIPVVRVSCFHLASFWRWAPLFLSLGNA